MFQPLSASAPAKPESARLEGRTPLPPNAPAGPDAAPATAPRPARRAAGRPAQGRQGGVLVVPEKLSPEDWTRSLREYYRVLEEPP